MSSVEWVGFLIQAMWRLKSYPTVFARLRLPLPSRTGDLLPVSTNGTLHTQVLLCIMYRVGLTSLSFAAFRLLSFREGRDEIVWYEKAEGGKASKAAARCEQ